MSLKIQILSAFSMGFGSYPPSKYSTTKSSGETLLSNAAERPLFYYQSKTIFCNLPAQLLWFYWIIHKPNRENQSQRYSISNPPPI